jgi:hypothetical protein
MTVSKTPSQAMAWLSAIREPAGALVWSLAEWERVIRLARRCRLLGRLAESIDAAGLLDRVPGRVRPHLVAEQRISSYRTASIVWALERIGDTLRGVAAPRVLLKGAAYLGQDLPIARGRLPSDVDIMVPREVLDEIVSRLKDSGWQEKKLDDYDRRYYLEWSHEVPPMVHPVHTVELDLHHNILPPMARTTVDAGLLFERLRPSKWDGWFVLDPIDQVLHSAAHLFFESELRDRVRDLVDIDGLVRVFLADHAIQQDLLLRAADLHLREALNLGMLDCFAWLGTPLAPSTRAALEIHGKRRLMRRSILALMQAALAPVEPEKDGALQQTIAGKVLLARYHLWRMPPHLLVQHLLRKLCMRGRNLS